MRNAITPRQQPNYKPLRFKNRRQLAAHRLPFVDRVPGQPGISFWAVPKAGGYVGGNETGTALARVYLRYLREQGQCRGGGILQLIVLDMMGTPDSFGIEEQALRGQAVGFFTELERWLSAAVQRLDGGLDKQDDKALLRTANAGLNFDEAAYLASLPDDDAEGAA